MGKGFTVTQTYISLGDNRMKLLILSPAINKQPRERPPGILWIHGSGYAVGMSRAKRLLAEYGAVVISPEYRWAGKVHHPAALEDCYQALPYLKEHVKAPVERFTRGC